MRPLLLLFSLLPASLLASVAAAQDVDIKKNPAEFQLISVKIEQGCIDENATQALGLARQIFQRAGIATQDSASLVALLTTSPCKEFAFADRGPRDLEDAPRGPIGSKIITPINRPQKEAKSATVRLVVRDRKNNVMWEGRTKADVQPGDTVQSTTLNLIPALLNALILQRGKQSD
jgi:hypothetical protein